MDPEGGQGLRTPPPPPENHINIGFLSNTGPDPLKNHKVTKPDFNVGPSSAHQRNAILMYGWHADDAPFIAVSGSSIPLSNKKKTLSNLEPLCNNFLDPRMQSLKGTEALKACEFERQALIEPCRLLFIQKI